MVHGVLEVIAMSLGLLGLIGAAATTGLPMWRVTAFIGENIIVMEARWEGLWMNCFRQANIRMQCKVYDSLLALSPDLQAARGLMCCSLGLAAVGLMVAVTGMRCTSCIQDNDRAKSGILMAAGILLCLACFCVLIPVAWTGHFIIRDFYNPLLIDAQRRELGAALYLGWVSSGLLLASGCMFGCCRVLHNSGSFYPIPPRDLGLIGPALIRPRTGKPALAGSYTLDQLLPHNVHSTPKNGTFAQNRPANRGACPVRDQQHAYAGSHFRRQPSQHGSNFVGHQPAPFFHAYIGKRSAPLVHNYAEYQSSHGSSFQPVVQSPILVRYHSSFVPHQSSSISSIWEYI